MIRHFANVIPQRLLGSDSTTNLKTFLLPTKAHFCYRIDDNSGILSQRNIIKARLSRLK